MTTKFKITETPHSAKSGKTLDDNLWVRGQIDNFVYDAKVYSCGSQYGIREGTISKLSIRDATTRREATAYDRGWDLLPESELVTEMVDSLVEHYWV